MLNILIIEKDYTKCKKIINKISDTNLNLKINNIASNDSEAIDIINKCPINIIILNLGNEKLSNSLVLNYIDKNNLVQYNNSILLISNYLLDSIDINEYKSIYCTIQSLDTLIFDLENLLKSKYILERQQNIIRTKINKELEFLCFNFSHIGTLYLSETILIIYFNKILYKNLNKNIYPLIAKKYQVSINNIKCNIFNASLNSYFVCEEKKLEKYLKKSCIEKPTTKDIIYAIIEHLKN